GCDDDDVRPQPDQLIERAAEALGSSFSPADVHDDVLARKLPKLGHSAHEACDEMLVGGSGARLEESDLTGLGLRLRAGTERREDQPTRKSRDERPSIH